MLARYPSFSRSRIASFWFTTLSSASRIRSGWCSARVASNTPDAPGSSPSSEPPSTIASAPCSGEALIGFVTTASMPAADHRGSATTSCWFTEDASTIGRPGRSAWMRAARSRPSVSGINMSRTARSTGSSSSAANAASEPAADHGLHPPRGQERAHQPAVRFVVVHHQRATALERPVAPQRRRRHVRGSGPERDVERAALAGHARARRPGLPAHEFGQAAADREPQPGPAVAPARRGVDLAEGLEQRTEAVRRDPDARVTDREVVLDRVRLRRTPTRSPRARSRRSR